MGKRIARYLVVDIFHTKKAKRRYKVARTILAGVLTFGAVVTSADFAGAADAVSLMASASTVAPGSTVDLTASMPVVSAGSTTQTLTQTIDPTKVKLTSASDITYPAGWTLSYSTDGTTFSTTPPTTPAGWAAVEAVRATGAVNSNGSDSNGYQIATGTATGSATSLAPPSISVSGTGDGYQVFFDPGHTRVFNIYHHKYTGSGQLDCHVLSTGATCTGFPFDMGIPRTPQSSIGRVVGTRIWVPAYTNLPAPASTPAVGFFCVDIAGVLASSSAPTMCTNKFVEMARGTTVNPTNPNFGIEADLYAMYTLTGVGTTGTSTESKLWSVLSSNGKLVCLDTATQAPCPGMPTGGWSSGLAIGGYGGLGTDIELWNNQIYVRGDRANNATSPGVVCVKASDPTLACDGWTNPYVISASTTKVGKLFPLPDASGSFVSMCLGPDGRQTAVTDFMLNALTTGISCWNSSGSKSDGPTGLSSIMTQTWSTNSSFQYAIDYSVVGTRIAWGNGVNYSNTTPEPPAIVCWDIATSSPCTTANLGTTSTANGSVTYTAAKGFGGAGAKNYTAVIDPVATNCLWIVQNDSPGTFLLNVVDGTSNCTAGAPTSASFSGTAIVPRMACQASSQPIRSWQSFTLTSAGTGTFTSAKLTVKNSSGVALASWTDIPLTLNTALDLSTLSPTDTGTTPTFAVSFAGITGSITTATAQVKVVGDAPQLCTKVTAVYPCPTGVGPISSLSDSVASVSAAGSSVLGGVTTTLTSANQSVTVTAPALSTCTSSITGRAGDAGGGASGNAIAGVTVSLLDSSGNPVLVGGTPVTATTASDGTYSFANLLPASYKVAFSTPDGKTQVSNTTVSGASGTTAGATTNAIPAACSSGSPTTIVTGLSVVNNANLLTRTSPINVVTNGDFDSAVNLSNNPITTSAYIAPNTLKTPRGSVVGWTVTGGGTDTYAGWSNTTGLSSQGTVIAPVWQWAGKASNFPSGNGASNAMIYFGNSTPWYVSPSVNWSIGSSVSRQTLTFTGPDVARYGSNSNPVTLSQAIPTTVGRRYRLQFFQGGESNFGLDGIAALELTGYGRTYFKVPYATYQRYTFEFVATASTTNLSFSSWGHISDTTQPSTELALDDVMVNACADAVPPANSPTFTTSAGTNAVVNALYSIPATATTDTSTGGQGVAQTINVLANDNAASGATLTATSVKLCGTSPVQTPPSCSQTSLTTADGSYSVNASTGVVTFTPNASFTGTATVVPTYQVTDSASNVVSSTITATVIPAPAASSDTSTGGVNQTQSKNVLANDTAANGSGGFAASNPVSLCTSGSTVSCTTGTSVTISGQGTYTVNASGVITFTPVSGYTGTPTPVTYVVTDALGGKSVSTYQPTVVPAPTATNDTTTGTAGATQSMNLLTNDAGAPGSGGLAPTNPVSLCTSGSSTSCTTGTTISNSAGTYTLDPMTGVISFTPASGFTGTAPAVTYVVTDALGSKATATYTPTVVAAPTANADTSSGGVNQTQTKNLLTNDSAATGQSIVSVGLCTSGSTVTCTTGTTVTNTSGTYTVDPASGVVTYSPANGYTGTPSPISYVVTDGLGGKAVSTYTPTVFAAPTATDKTTVGVMGATQTSNLFTGDTVNGAAYSLPGSLAIALCTSGTATSCTTGNSVSNASGTYTLNPVTGVISYVPANGYSGTPQAITYVITDGVGQKVVATYTPTVVPPPTPVADTTTGAWNTTQILNLISNSVGTSDTAGAGSGGFAASNPVKLCGPSDTAPNCSIDSSSSTGLVISGQGTYRISNSGVVTFTPIATFTGTATPITYSVTDSLGQNAATTYTPTVANPNAPLASADATSGPMGATQSVNVLTNDAPGIANNADLSLVASSVNLCDPTTTPAQVAPHCTATTVNVAGVGLYSVNSSGVVSFTPDANFSGTPTSLSYQVADNTGQIATAAYTPTVIPPPTVVADTSSGAWDVNQTISVLGNDSAAPGATLVTSSLKLCGPADTAPNCTATSVTTSEGTYTVNSNGTVSFDPLPSFSGTAIQSVTYSVTDSLGQKASTTITPSVTPPTAPTARPETKQLLPNTTVAFTTISGASGLASGTQLDPASVCLVDPISQSCVTSLTTSDGTWVVDPTNGVVTYNSTSTTPGTQVAVTYRVSDVTGHTASSTLTPVVPGAPTARPDTSIAEQGAVQWISPLGNDSPGSASVGLDPATVALCGAQQSPPNCSATTLTVAGEGTYTVDAFGLVRFTPEPNFTGVATPVTYQVADTLGQRATSTITVTVEPPPYPSAVVDTGSAPAGHTVTFKPWLNDSAGTKPSTTSLPDPSLVVPSIRLCSANQSAPHCSATRITTVDGTYVLNTSTGEVVFTPASGFIGTATQPPTYQISNDWSGLAGAGTTTALLIPTITPVGSPAASIDSTTTRPGGSVVITPVNNDKPGNARLNPTTIRLCSATEVAPNCTQTRVTTGDGTYVVNTRTGKVTFTALANFRGITTIPYVIFDAGGYAANSQIIVTVKSASQPPQDNSDSDHPLANTGGNLPEQSLVITTLLIIGIKFIRPTQRNKQAA